MTPQEIEINHLRQNLGYLFALRLIAIGTQALALGFMYFYLHLQFAGLPLIVLILVLLLFTVYSWQRLAASNHINSGTFMFQLIVDIVALSCLIYMTGGSSNPFIFFFLLPITFAAATLRFKQTCIIAILAAASYSLLMFFHVPLLDHAGHHDGFDLHIWGMWYGFLISAALLTYYVSRVGARIRERNRALAAAREENLRSEQILALGTLAAGTAHELGTPLSTMAILAKELEHDYQSDEELQGNLRVLRTQIDRCKDILSKLAQDAGTTHAKSGSARELSDYLHQLVEDWHELRPDSLIELEIEQNSPSTTVIIDETLSQSIRNVLNNAADAARHKITFYAQWTMENLSINIHDDGEGIHAELLDELGQTIIKPDQSNGMGIGLFLAQITLNRMGGHLHLDDNNENGTTVSIHLPLASIKTGEG